MANRQIPNLPAATSLTGSELFEIVQAGSSARTTLTAIAAFAGSSPIPGDSPLTDDGMNYIFGQDDNGLSRRGKLPYLTPDNYYLGGSDETAALLRTRDKARTLGVPVLVSAPQTITQTYEMEASGDALIIPSGVGLNVHETLFSGTRAVTLGVDASGDPIEFCSIVGGGYIQCNNVIDKAIEVIKARFSRIQDLDLFGANVNALHVGTSADTYVSYEIDASYLRAYYNNVANSASSIAFNIDQCSDSHYETCYSIGYRQGFLIEQAAVDLHGCHVWNRPVHGPLTHCFNIQGNQNKVTACYADTPTNNGDGSITDVYGFYVHGFNTLLDANSIFMNVALQTDGVINCVYEDRATFSDFGSVVIFGGVSGTQRFKKAVSLFSDSTTVRVIKTPGSTYFSGSPAGLSTVRSYTNENVVDWGVRNFAVRSFHNGGLTSLAAVRSSGAAGTDRDFVMQTSGVDRWKLRANNAAESGSNTGSDFYLNSQNDDGTFKATTIEVTRSDSNVSVPRLVPQLTDTAANIAAIGSTVNTVGKKAGLLVWDTTNNRMMRAASSAAGGVWWVIDGSASVTPV